MNKKLEKIINELHEETMRILKENEGNVDAQIEALREYNEKSLKAIKDSESKK